eukprot:5824305-Prymnesium_polylepis.1
MAGQSRRTPQGCAQTRGRTDNSAPKHAVEQLQLLRVPVNDAFRLLLVGAAAEEHQALLEEDIQVATPRTHVG